MTSTKEQVWAGIIELVAGEKQADRARGDRGHAMVELALKRDDYILMELHKSALEMFDVALPYLVGNMEASDKFLAARELHQKCLAKLSGGDTK